MYASKQRSTVILKKIFALLTAFILAFMLFPAVNAAQQSTGNGQRTVKVGYYITPGFQEYDEETGSYSGYSYEYLLALAQYSNWNYEFVPVSFADGVTALEKGEIDLMNNVSITEERQEYLSYSSSPSGSNCAYLVTKSDNKSVAYEDFEAFSKLNVGLVTTSIYSEKFISYCEENGFMPNIKYYETKEEAIAAMDSGEIDARVITSSQNVDMHIIAKFAPEDFYFAVPNTNTELLRELNQAMSSLKTNDPDFEVRLDKKYYSNVADNNTVLTSGELAFIKNNPVVTVAYDKYCYPLSYQDEDGNFAGTISEIYKLISEKVGLKFEFKASDPNALGTLTSDNEAMLYAELPYDYTWAADYSVRLTPPFTDISVMEARRAGYTGEGGVVAVVEGYYLTNLCESIYGNAYSFKTYSSTEDCVNAVVKGEADLTCLTSYEAEYYQSQSKYRSLIFSVAKQLNYSLSIGVAKNADPNLYSVMLKALNSISDDEINALFRATTIASQQSDFLSFALNHLEITVPVLAFIVFLVAGLVFVLLYSRAVKKKNTLIGVKNAQLADAVAQADRANTAKSQFLSRMSHEIRTPMNAIVGLTTIAKQHEAEPEKIDDYLTKIDVSSKVLLNIINDVLDMSAIESNKLKIASTKFDIKQVITGISTIYYPQCESKGVKFEMATDLEHEMLVGDSLRVSQVLLNMVSNAYKFTESGGSIKVFVKETAQKNNKVFMRFTVSDTGCGMSPEMMDRLFKPFEQETADTAKKHGGSGLGLSIAKNLIDMMHGAVKVESEKGKGTTFTIDIPFEMAEEVKELKTENIKNLRVLVVDDDSASLEYTGIVLKRIGMDFDTALSGAEALKLLDEAENTKPYDVCLVDWKMPDMNGVELTKRIRDSRKQNTMVVIVSAYDLNEVEDQARSAGADYFVSKPLFQSTVFNVLMTLSGGKLSNSTAEPDHYDFTGHKVLLAEDNEMNAEIAGELLSMVNLQVDRAENGDKALHMFADNPEKTYELILMDVQMPIMDGYEATKAIRALTRPDAKTIPILAMTANAFTEDISAAISAGMNGHIAKPIDTKVLYDTLAKYIK